MSEESEIRWALFASGFGSNLENVLKIEKEPGFQNQKIVWIHTNRECPAAEKARTFNKETFVLSSKLPNYEKQVLEALQSHRINGIFLLGYMRILSASFIEAFQGCIVNLHPSLLPKYPGLDSIRRAYEAGDEKVGVTLHQVTADLDAGPILKQMDFLRDSKASLEEITEKVHDYERKLVRDFLFDLESSSAKRLGLLGDGSTIL